MDTTSIIELIPLGLIWLFVFLFSTTLHEAAHAWAAKLGGDLTAYHGGQVTLNPVPHIRREPFGMVLLPILSFFGSGGSWMMGWASAPFDPVWAHEHPRRAAWMAAAGPAANLLLMLVSAVLIRLGMLVGVFERGVGVGNFFTGQIVATLGGPFEPLATVLSLMFMLNVLLFAFNLIPLPPLDGSSVITLLMPDSLIRRYTQIVRQPMFSLVGMIVAFRFGFRLVLPALLLAKNLLFIGI